MHKNRDMLEVIGKHLGLMEHTRCIATRAGLGYDLGPSRLAVEAMSQVHSAFDRYREMEILPLDSSWWYDPAHGCTSND